MSYQSSRNQSIQDPSPRAILNGIAPDGGLYLDADLGKKEFDWKGALNDDFLTMSSKILSYFFPEFSDMENLVKKGYENKFDVPDLTPLVKVGDRYVLELWHGPTAAFKDVALSILPQLMTAARKAEGYEGDTVILTATSGDTGKAALEGFHDVDGIRIIVFFPNEGVSKVQQTQMVTQEGKNVTVCAINGNFDDAQSAVKDVFQKCSRMDLKGQSLSSANSINIGRLAPQVVYYFKAYADLVKMGKIKTGDPVDFVVPTGNFGDILAGYFAKRIGLPIHILCCASNANNVLTDFIETGCYDRRRTFYKTTSPSMDILVSSNLERLLYYLCRDEETVRDLMESLKTEGCYRISDEMLGKLQEEFCCGYCDDRMSSASIHEVWEKYHYLCDPHTAVAWNVSDKFIAEKSDEIPTVVLSTASPFKFPKTCIEAIGEKPCEDEFDIMEQLQSLTGLKIPKGLCNLKEKDILHKDVIEKNEIMDYVLRKLDVK